MQTLIVDPEFRDKIPPLSADEFSKLEENIVADGEVREPLVLWRNTIIDGHHRWKIIQKHPDISYKVKRMEFPDKWAAIAWMCKNQLGRRNLTDAQKTYLVGKQYEAERHCESFHGNQYTQKNGDDQNGQHQTGATRQRIAIETGTSEGYVQRAEQYAKALDVAEKVSPGFKESVLSGEIKPTGSVVRSINNVPEENRAKIVGLIKSGDALGAKTIIQASTPKAEKAPKEEGPAYDVADFRGELQAVVKNMDWSLKQTLVLVHREMLDSKSGRKAAMEILQAGSNVLEKYKKMILEVQESGEPD